MKVEISLPDDVFDEADRTARRLGLSRSELFTRALRAFLADHLEEHVTASYNKAFGDVVEPDMDELRAVTRRALAGVEWE